MTLHGVTLRPSGRTLVQSTASGDGGAHWRDVLSTLGGVLIERLPDGPGSYPGPFSVIDPGQAVLFSPTPTAEATGAVLISQRGRRLRRLPDVPGTSLFVPRSVSFASATRGWAVGANLAGRPVLLATTDGGRRWHSQLPSDQACPAGAEGHEPAGAPGRGVPQPMGALLPIDA